MKRLLISEYKKIFKKKFNIFLILLMICITGLRIYKTYTKYDIQSYNLPINLEFETKEHKKLDTKIELYKEADQYLHSYTQPMDISLLDTLKNDYYTNIKQFMTNELDETKMEKYYGKDWKNFLTRIYYKQVNEEEMEKRAAGLYQINDDRYDIVVFKKNDAILNFYNLIYRGFCSYTQSSDLFASNKVVINRPLIDWYRDRFDNFKTDQEKMTTLTMFFHNVVGDVYKDNQMSAKYYIDKFNTKDYQYDSSVGIGLVLQNLTKVDFINLFFIVLLISNLFAQEHRYHMNQLILPSKKGCKQVVYAKILCGITVSLGLLGIQFFMIFITSLFTKPIHSSDILYYGELGNGLNNVMNFIFTYKEIIICMIFMMMLAYIFTSILTMYLSYITKNQFIVTVIMFAFILLPIIYEHEFTGNLGYVYAFLLTTLLNAKYYFMWTQGGAQTLIPFMKGMIPYRNVVEFLYTIVCIGIVLILIKQYKQKKKI